VFPRAIHAKSLECVSIAGISCGTAEEAACGGDFVLLAGWRCQLGDTASQSCWRKIGQTRPFCPDDEDDDDDDDQAEEAATSWCFFEMFSCPWKLQR